MTNLLARPSHRIGASALSGFLLFACFPLLGWNFLVWVACAPLLAALLREPRLGRAFLLAYATGAIFLAGSCYWFVGVMEGYGGMRPVLAWGALVLFVGVFSALFGAFGLVESWVARRSHVAALLLSPCLWVAMEIARTYLVTGFPWNLLGYAVQADGLRQIASITGVYGLSFLAVATAAWFAAVLVGRCRWLSRVGCGSWVLLLAVSNVAARVPRGGVYAPYPAYLVQPNVPMDVDTLRRWRPWGDSRELDSVVAMSTAPVLSEAKRCAERTEDEKLMDEWPFIPRGGEPIPKGSPPVDTCAVAPLIVWPENPAPFYFERDPIFRGAVERMARQAHAYVIVGSVNYADRENTQPKNSAIVLDPEGRVLLMYDKIHLVPFGEYVPAWAFPGLVGKITYEAGNFVPGTSYQVARTRDGAIGVFICYEAIFPQLVRRLVTDGPGVLVNISNDAWFGDSSAAAQHLEMARLRAIENRRFLLRATNDGITAIVDPYGRILRELPRHKAAVLSGQFDYRAGRTFYTKHGDVFAWLCVAAAGALIAATAIRERKIQGRKSKVKNRVNKQRTTDN